MRKILEKSLSRVYQHMQEHDSGFITAYRSEYSHGQNQQRNKSLLAKLQSQRYGVTSVEGSYIENYGTSNEIEVGEHVFFVVDLYDKGNLKSALMDLGNEFDQDSILFIPEGGSKGFLIGTSKREDTWPGFGNVITLQSPVFGEKGEFFTKVRNRPFTLSAMSESTAYALPEGYFGRYACKMIADMPWDKISL